MIENIIKKYNSTVNKYYARKARIGLIKKYNLEIAVDRLLKDWITECIVSRGHEGRRKELVDNIAKIKESELFIHWLKNK